MIFLHTFVFGAVISLLAVSALATTAPSENNNMTYTLAKGITDAESAKEDAEVLLWQIKKENRGALVDVLYRFMNKEALKLLVNHGNVKAMRALAHKIYWDAPARSTAMSIRQADWKQIYDNYNRNVYNQAIALYELAIIHGSTKAIGKIVELKISSFVRKDYSELSDEDKKITLAEVLAWYEFSKLRGDRHAGIYPFNNLFKDNDIKLAAEDVRQAQLSAAELYKDFAKRRAALGLGEFDNYEPDSVKQWSDKLLSGNPYEQLRNKQI